MAERHVIVDPYVVAVPNDASKLDSYVSGLITWLPLLNTRRDTSSFFEAAMHALVQEDKFPTHATLTPILSLVAAPEFSIVDLLRMVTALTATEPFFETLIQRRAAAATDIVVNPADVIERLGPKVGAATQDSMVLAAVAQNSGWGPESIYWATSAWENQSDWIETTAHVSIVETADGELEVVERQVTAVLPVVRDPKEIEFSDSLVDIYNVPTKAVALVLHRLRQYDATIPESVVITASDRFVASLEAHNIHQQLGVLEAVFQRAALAALGRLGQIAGAKLHWVRINAAADAPQKSRSDGAKLWRCMITKKGAGYRLHYWVSIDGSVELEEVMLESQV